MSPRDAVDKLDIGQACPADLAPFGAAERKRHCSICNKNVNNISTLTRNEAVALLEREGTAGCFTFIKSAKGEILTREAFAPERRDVLRWLKRCVALAIVGGVVLVTRRSILEVHSIRYRFGLVNTPIDVIQRTALYQNSVPVKKAVDWAAGRLYGPFSGSSLLLTSSTGIFASSTGVGSPPLDNDCIGDTKYEPVQRYIGKGK